MLNKKYFFIGIGGIGMSSIAQFLHDKGNIVFGYDQSNNRSIEILLKKGIAITNKLNLEEILRLVWIPIFSVFIFYLSGVYNSVLRYIDLSVIYFFVKLVVVAL